MHKSSASSRSLDVIVDTQIDYMLPGRPTSVLSAQNLIAPGIEWICSRTPKNSFGVLFTGNKFTESEYEDSELRKEWPAHCLVGGLGDYDPVGVQNVFSQRLCVSRGVPTFHLYKKRQDMWKRDTDGMQANVHAFQGSVATSYSLPEFIGAKVKESGVVLINIWGVATDGALADAVAGFLEQNFRVNVVTNLCKGRHVDNEDFLKTTFKKELASEQLVLSPWLKTLTLDTKP